jgi:hypothetical protein
MGTAVCRNSVASDDDVHVFSKHRGRRWWLHVTDLVLLSWRFWDTVYSFHRLTVGYCLALKEVVVWRLL